MLDSTFAPTVGGGGSGVYAIAVRQDGRILLGGSFLIVNGAPRNGLALVDVAGVVDPALVVTSINSPPDNVAKIVVQPDGKLLVAGNFVAFGILGSAKLARFNSDGTIDPDFIPQAYVDAGCCNGYVADIALQPDGKVVAGGSYTPLTIARFWPNIFNQLPMISFIADRALVGTEPLTTGPIGFTVSDPEGRPITVTAASSNSAVVPLTGIVLDGSTSSRTVTVNPAVGAAGQSTLTLTASDGVRQAARSFVVTSRASTETPRAA